MCLGRTAVLMCFQKGLQSRVMKPNPLTPTRLTPIQKPPPPQMTAGLTGSWGCYRLLSVVWGAAVVFVDVSLGESDKLSYK